MKTLGVQTASGRFEPVAVKSWTLKVTRGIIDISEPGHSRHCMVANAVRACVPGAWSVNVDANKIRFNLGGEPGKLDGKTAIRYEYDVPADASVKIADYDEDPTEARPFTIKLQAGQCFVKLVARRIAHHKSKHGQGKRKRPNLRRCVVRRYRGVKQIVPG